MGVAGFGSVALVDVVDSEVGATYNAAEGEVEAEEVPRFIPQNSAITRKARMTAAEIMVNSNLLILFMKYDPPNAWF
jgi:hypothetical protein